MRANRRKTVSQCLLDFIVGKVGVISCIGYESRVSDSISDRSHSSLNNIVLTVYLVNKVFCMNKKILKTPIV